MPGNWFHMILHYSCVIFTGLNTQMGFLGETPQYRQSALHEVGWVWQAHQSEKGDRVSSLPLMADNRGLDTTVPTVSMLWVTQRCQQNKVFTTHFRVTFNEKLGNSHRKVDERGKKNLCLRFWGLPEINQIHEAKKNRASNRVAQYFDNLLINLYHKSKILELPEEVFGFVF